MPSGGSRCREHAVPRRGWAHERATDPANSKGDFSVPAAPDTDAEGRYADVVARRDAIRTAWEAEGSPLLTAGSTGQLVEHPFVKMLLLHGLLSIAARTRAKAPRRPGALGRHEAVDRRVAGGEAPSGDLVARPDAGKWKPTAVSTTVGPSCDRPATPDLRRSVRPPARVRQEAGRRRGDSCGHYPSSPPWERYHARPLGMGFGRRRYFLVPRPRGLMAPRWRCYAAGSEIEHFAKFCRGHLIQSEDRWEGNRSSSSRGSGG
jgi:hypothetical protein